MLSFLSCPLFWVIVSGALCGLHAYQWKKGNTSTWNKVAAVVWGVLMVIDLLRLFVLHA
jgi:hypothetical protein